MKGSNKDSYRIQDRHIEKMEETTFSSIISSQSSLILAWANDTHYKKRASNSIDTAYLRKIRTTDKLYAQIIQIRPLRYYLPFTSSILEFEYSNKGQ